MRTPSLHRVAPFLLAGIVVLLGATSGCATSSVAASDMPVSPLSASEAPAPVTSDAPALVSSDAPAPVTSKATESKGTESKAAKPGRRNGCEGAVLHTVNGAAPGTRQLCIAVGGSVRITGFGPGDSVDARPASMVDCFYGGGVHQCRLLRTGKVRFTMGGRTLTVRVPQAAPGQPTTACEQPGAVSDLDTTEEFMWSAPCLRVGATLRVLNLGPGLLQVTPAVAVDCSYDATAYSCKIRKPATLVVTAE